MWRSRLGRGCGPVIRQTTELQDDSKFDDRRRHTAQMMGKHVTTHTCSPRVEFVGGGGKKPSNSLCQVLHLLFYCRRKCSSQCVCSVCVWPENEVMWPIDLLLKDLPDWHCVSRIRHRAIGAVHSAEAKSHRPQIWRWSPVVNHYGAMADDTERGINTTDVTSA